MTGDLAAARSFVAGVDSSAVIVNASTRFNDGGQLGLGAEIGISTDKYHARGPCGLRELTSTKWIVFGDGQVRDVIGDSRTRQGETPAETGSLNGRPERQDRQGILTTAVYIFETARNRWENREISRSDDCTMNSFGA